MEFKSRSRKNPKPSNQSGRDESCPLSYYSQPPACTVSLQDFEDIAIQRLKVLKAVEDFQIKWRTDELDDAQKQKMPRHKANDERLNKLMIELLELRRKEHLPILNAILNKNAPSKVKDDNEEQCLTALKVDHISHYILRLAYCRTEDLKKWFLQQEVDLFAMRYQIILTQAEKTHFLHTNNLGYHPIDNGEQTTLRDVLVSATRSLSGGIVDEVQFFKVPFSEALEFVRGRKVLVRAGFAYIPDYDLTSLIVAAYRSHLSQQLALMARLLPHLEEDHRLLPLLSGLTRRYLGQDYAAPKTDVPQIRAEMLDELASTSFPLCMKNMHRHIKQNHHLRNQGRLQYGLYLKGIGVPLEESLRFWKIEFTKNPNIDVDKFEKQYAYGVRYRYGKEGKRANYTPYSCMKIIMSNHPAAGDVHGCPFKHHGPEALKSELTVEGISPDAVQKIMRSVEGEHYQIACSYYFGAKHAAHLRKLGSVSDKPVVIEHPNQYFIESQKIIKGEQIVVREEDHVPSTEAGGLADGLSSSTASADTIQNSGTGTDMSGIGLTPEDLAMAVKDMEDEEMDEMQMDC